MSPLLRRSLAALAVVLVVLVITIVAVVAWVEPNAYRARIEQSVSRAAGRPFQVTGDIDITWFPWLALETGNAQLGNPPGITAPPIIAWQRARLGARLLPLLRGELVVDRLRFEGLRVHLHVAADGRTNWESIAGLGERHDAPNTGTAAIPENAGVEIRSGALEYVDARSGRSIGIRDWELDIGAFEAGRSFPVRTRFRYDALPVSLRIPAFQVDLGRKYMAAPAWTLELGAARFNGSLEASDGGKVLRGALEGEIPSVRKLLAAFGEAPTTRDASVYGAASVAGALRYTNGAFEIAPLRLVLDATTLSGTVSHAGSGAAGMWRFALRGDRIDLDRYRAPEGSPGEPFEFPATALKAARVTGTVAFDEARVAGALARDVRFRVLTEEPAT